MKKEVVIFLSFFVFEEKYHVIMSIMTPCIIYFNIMGFMQSKLKELLSLSFVENRPLPHEHIQLSREHHHYLS